MTEWRWDTTRQRWVHQPCGLTFLYQEPTHDCGAGQLELEPTPPPAAGDDRLWDSFHQFHLAHPEVMGHLEQLVDEWLVRGQEKLGIEMLWNVLRWQTRLGAMPGEDDYQLNNNHKAFYARLLVAVHQDDPAWVDCFDMRRSVADRYEDQLEELAEDWRNR